jgi:hypothetical protein
VARHGRLEPAVAGADLFLSPEITDVLSAGEAEFAPCGGEFRRVVGEVEEADSFRAVL